MRSSTCEGLTRRFIHRSRKDERWFLSMHFNKCDLIVFCSNTTDAGCFPSHTAVANAITNTPQSLDPLCHWTSWNSILMEFDLCWKKLAIVFFALLDNVMCRLSYTFTTVSEWDIEDDMVIQWLPLMFKIWTNSPCCCFKAIVVAKTGDCKEPIFGWCFFKLFWQAAIMASSSHALEFWLSISLWKL